MFYIILDYVIMKLCNYVIIIYEIYNKGNYLINYDNYY